MQGASGLGLEAQSEAINRFADAERLKIADTYFVRPRPSVQPSNRSFGSVLFITDQSGRPCRPRVPSLKHSFCHAALKTKFVTGITDKAKVSEPCSDINGRALASHSS